MKHILAALILLTLATPAWGGFDEPPSWAEWEQAVSGQYPEDYAMALHKLRPLAEQGDAAAQFDLGIMYEYGQGVTKDYVEAVNWYRKAATQGHAKGQAILGLMYAKGQGVKQDYAKAVKWWYMAAEQGDAGAQLNLGVAHDKGEGVPQDYVMAHKWYNLAATQRYKSGAKYRDRVAKKMTSTDISKAQKLAREWWAAYRKGK